LSLTAASAKPQWWKLKWPTPAESVEEVVPEPEPVEEKTGLEKLIEKLALDEKKCTSSGFNLFNRFKGYNELCIMAESKVVSVNWMGRVSFSEKNLGTFFEKLDLAEPFEKCYEDMEDFSSPKGFFPQSFLWNARLWQDEG